MPALNPNALEWRPNSHPSAAPAPLPLAPPPPKLLPQFPFQYPSYYPQYPDQGFIPNAGCTPCQLPAYYLDAAHPPSYGCFRRTIRNPKSIPVGETKIDDKIESCKVKFESPKGNAVDKKFRRRKVFPPRFRRAARSFQAARKTPIKQEWRVTKPSQTCQEASGYGGSSDSPPSSASDQFSVFSNTTVMIRNIPNKLRRDFMLKFLDEHCKSFTLEYDFLYLPMDFRKEGNLGYAFVNFTSTAAALQFKGVLENYKWQMINTDRGPITSKKICEVTWARIQGKEALVKRFKNSSFYCNDLEFLPVVLDPPRNGSDPDPSPPMVLGKLIPGH